MNKPHLITWLKERPLIKISALERMANVPFGSLSNAINGKPERLSEKHLPAIAECLKPYGYTTHSA